MRIFEGYPAVLPTAWWERGQEMGLKRTRVAKARGAVARDGVELSWAERVRADQGACGAEMLVGLLEQMRWVESYGELPADLGLIIQVRWVEELHKRLIWRPRWVDKSGKEHGDRDDHVYVLLVGTPPRFWVMGWKWGRDCQRPEWKYDGNGRPMCYLVPQGALERYSRGCLAALDRKARSWLAPASAYVEQTDFGGVFRNGVLRP